MATATEAFRENFFRDGKCWIPQQNEYFESAQDTKMVA